MCDECEKLKTESEYFRKVLSECFIDAVRQIKQLVHSKDCESFEKAKNESSEWLKELAILTISKLKGENNNE